MKKWKGILAVILITGCLGGCSQFQAEHNAVKVKRDGSVQAAVIDTLDKSYYSEDELKQTIDDSVSAYNQSQEGDPIVVKKFNVTDGKAELYMNYAASRDYQDFNNVTFYTPPAREKHINEPCLLPAGENRYAVQRQGLASQVY